MGALRLYSCPVHRRRFWAMCWGYVLNETKPGMESPCRLLAAGRFCVFIKEK